MSSRKSAKRPCPSVRAEIIVTFAKKDSAMDRILDDKQYKATMARIDDLFFATDETTPSTDPRLMELDRLSALVEDYERRN